MALSKYVMQPTPGADIRRYASAELQKIERALASIPPEFEALRAEIALELAALQALLVWTAPTFLNGWVDFDTDRAVGYTKDAFGWVHIRGLIKNGTMGTAVFVLPAGYRPLNNRNMMFATISNAGAADLITRVNITATGTLQVSNGGNIYCSLDGISFYTGS